MPNFDEIIQSSKPTLVDFFASWCGPCQLMTAILKDLKTNLGDKLTILKINVDNNASVSTHYKVQGVPTIVLFKDGNIVWRQSGYMPLKQLQQEISPYI